MRLRAFCEGFMIGWRKPATKGDLFWVALAILIQSYAILKN